MLTLKVGFTGTRDGMTPAQEISFERELRLLLDTFRYPSEFHHGDCVGADAQAFEHALRFGMSIHCHPPNNPYRQAFTYSDVKYPPAPYRERNRHIVAKVLFLFACPKGAQQTPMGGSWYTYNHAAQQGKHKRAMLIYPDGVTLFPRDRWLLPLDRLLPEIA